MTTWMLITCIVCTVLCVGSMLLTWFLLGQCQKVSGPTLRIMSRQEELVVKISELQDKQIELVNKVR